MRLHKVLSLAFNTMATGIRNYHDESMIRKILTETKTIALVGASNKPERPAYHVMQFLLSKGYTVIPVNPGLAGNDLLGQTVYADLAAIPDTIDMVDIFRNSEAVPEIVEEAITVGAKTIWMQVGVINEDAAQTAEAAGMQVVMNACPKIEMPKLGIAGPSSQL